MERPDNSEYTIPEFIRTADPKLLPQAVPFALELNFDKSDVEPRLAALWAAVKDTIPEAQWKGFRVGSDAYRTKWEASLGIATAYRSVWVNLIDAACRHNKTFLLHLSSLNVVERDGKYRLNSIFYTTPNAELTEVAENIPVEVYSVHETMVERTLQARVEEARLSASTFTPIERQPLIGDKAKLKIAAQVDGVAAPDWSVDNQMFHLSPGKMHPDALIHAIVGKNVNQEFDFECVLPPIFREFAGKKYTARVTVLEVLARQNPSDEELAKSHGFETYDEYLTAMKTEITEEMLKARQQTKEHLALHYVRQRAKFSPLPVAWITTRATRQWEMYCEGRGTEDALRELRVPDKSTAIASIAGELADELRDQSATLAWGAKVNAINYDESYDHNVLAVRRHMLDRVVVEEVVPLSARPA